MTNDHVSARTWIAVVGAALGAFLAILNIQIVSSSLSDIQGAIGAGSDEGGWITTAYLVAEIIVIPMSGWLARVFSTRIYLLTNTVLFLILTVACAFAQNLGQMIVLRAMQGFAGGVLIPLAFSIIMTRLPPSKHAIGLSIYSISAIFAPSIGPVIGGYFNQTFGWQSIFYVNLLPGTIMLGLLWYSLDPEPRQLDLLRRGDWWGIISIAIGLGCLETVLEEGEKDDWFGSPFIVRLSVIAAVALSVLWSCSCGARPHCCSCACWLGATLAWAHWPTSSSGSRCTPGSTSSPCIWPVSTATTRSRSAMC